MKTNFKNGDYYINKTRDGAKGLMVLCPLIGRIIFQFDDGNIGWMPQNEFLNKYKYSHYIPTHQEMG
jgi:hypothetical protein